MESLQTYERMKTRSIYTRVLRKFYFWMDGNSLLFKLVILTPTVRVGVKRKRRLASNIDGATDYRLCLAT